MINFNSTQDISRLFFGGWVKETISEPVLNEFGVAEIFKSGLKKGQIKTKNIVKERYIKGLGLEPRDGIIKGKNGFYSTDEGTLKKIVGWFTDDTAIAKCIAQLMLKKRELEKLNGTYLEGMKKHMYPDSCIRGNINHVTTETGRTSSNKPNLQNLPN